MAVKLRRNEHKNKQEDFFGQWIGKSKVLLYNKATNRLIKIKEIAHSLAKGEKVAYKPAAFLTNEEKLALIERTIEKYSSKIKVSRTRTTKEELKRLKHNYGIYDSLIAELHEILGVIEVLPPTLFKVDFKQKRSDRTKK